MDEILVPPESMIRTSVELEAARVSIVVLMASARQSAIIPLNFATLMFSGTGKSPWGQTRSRSKNNTPT